MLSLPIRFFPRHVCAVGWVSLLILTASSWAGAQEIAYEQSFDTPVGPNGDVYFTTSPIYNGITDASSSNGITTGGSFAGSPVVEDGVIATSFGALTPQSGPYFLEEQTNSGPVYTGTVFSTAGTAITVLPQNTYQLSFYYGVVNMINPPALQVYINGVAVGAPLTPTATNVMQKFTFNYNSGAASNIVIAIENNTATGYGNDFALDTIQFTIAQATFPLAGLTPNQAAIAQNLSSGVLNPVSTAVYNALIANASSYPGVLNQLSPEAFGRFTSMTAFNDASFEIEAMDNYLASERDPNGNFFAGNGKINSSGLTVNDAATDAALAPVASRLMAWSAAPVGGMISDVSDPLFSGVDMKDAKDMKSTSAPEYADPWNFFVRGNVVLAQGFSNNDVSHFDDNTESVIVGTDYRVTGNFLVGLKAGYSHTDATLDDNGSSATIDSYSTGLYASYADKGWYANVIGDYVHNAYTEERNIGFLGQTANGAPEGNEGFADLDGGYDFHDGALTYGPIAGVQYTHLSVNGYTESGSAADLTVQDQEDDSLRSRLGGRVSYAFSHYGLVFKPHLDATWQHEFMDQSRGITSQFDTTGLGSFTVRTEDPQRDFAMATAGLDLDINRTIMAFAEYMVQAGQSNYFGQAVQAGIKIGF
jgi:uncharacterized protein with beta-barrel porin domain